MRKQWADDGFPTYRSSRFSLRAIFVGTRSDRIMTRIALLNVKYSPNLGDGVIAECLEYELARLHPDWDISSIDLAGRDGFGNGPEKARGRAIRILNSLPGPARTIAAATALRVLIELRYRKRWKRQMRGVSGMILGGGQLIADADLNFPLKIEAILQEVARLNASFAVFGVGVSDQLSVPAKRLLNKAFRAAPPVHVAVRDDASIASWDRHFAGYDLPNAAPCRDPGLLAHELYTVTERLSDGAPPMIGVGIVDPRTLALHSEEVELSSIQAAREFWEQLCRRLLEMGYRIRLFTNGPADDEEFLDSVHAELQDTMTEKAPRPRVPRQLADTVSGMDAIVAHRLHANILAYSFRVPHVGLSWDPKVSAFFGSVGRPQFVADTLTHEPDQVAALIKQSIEEGIDEASHADVLAETRAAIARCASDLFAASDTVAASQVEYAFGARFASQDIKQPHEVTPQPSPAIDKGFGPH